MKRYYRRLLAALRDWPIVVDLVLFWLRFRFLGRCSTDTNPEKTVLIVSMTNWVAQAKEEGMLALACRRQGHTPVVLTYRSNKWALLYFKMFGIRAFIFFDDLLNEIDLTFDPGDALNFLDRNPSFREILDVKINVTHTGMNVLSTLVRTIRGNVQLTEPGILDQVRVHTIESMRCAAAAKRVFDHIHPQAVLFREKGCTPYAEVFDEAIHRELNIVQSVHTHRGDAMSLKRYSAANRSQHTFSFEKETWETVKALPWNSEDEEKFMQGLKDGYEQGTWFNRKLLLDDKKIKTPNEVRAQLGLDPQKKTAVIFSHVLWDATFFYGKNLFDDYEEWLVETTKVACENDAVNWVIKLHPDYAWKMKQLGDSGDPQDITALETRVGELPKHIHVVLPDTDISTYSFFGITDYCLTVRGTIGIEAPCFGIPVITAGTGRYSGLGFTNDSETREKYLEKIRSIQDIPALSDAETSLARRHAAFLFEKRPLVFTSFNSTHKSLKNIRSRMGFNVEIFTRSCKDVEQADDLRIFGEWVLHSDEIDLL